MTCWRRLREWQQAGVWQQLHELLLARLNEADRIDWSRRRSTARTCGVWGGAKTGPSVDRCLSGSKRHLIVAGAAALR